jgi:hypothetical protein
MLKNGIISLSVKILCTCLFILVNAVGLVIAFITNYYIWWPTSLANSVLILGTFLCFDNPKSGLVIIAPETFKLG